MIADGRNLSDSEVLARVLRDRQLGPAAKLAFLMLWWRAGGWVNEIIITPAWLGAQLGCDRKTAWGWLDRLRQNELIDVIHRNKRTGELRIQVRNPCPGNREPTPDPQGRLPLAHADGDADHDDEARPTSHGGGAPADAARGGLPFETPAPPDADFPPGVLGAETPAPQVPIAATTSAHAEGRAGVYDAKPPRLFGTKEEEKFILPKYQSLQSTKVPKYQSTKVQPDRCAGVYDAKPPRGEEAAFAAELDARQRQEAARMEASLTRGVMVALPNPPDGRAQLAQKRMLVDQIQAHCGGNVARWVAGSAANLVVYYGVSIEDFNRLLVDVDEMRRVGRIRTSRAAFFHSQARKLAARHGKPWPRHMPESDDDRF